MLWHCDLFGDPFLGFSSVLLAFFVSPRPYFILKLFFFCLFNGLLVLLVCVYEVIEDVD